MTDQAGVTARTLRGPARRGPPDRGGSPTQRGLLVRLMGGMAIRAHAPDWPARTRRVEVDLDFATRGKDRGAFYELLEAEGYTAGQAAQRAVRRQAGVLRGRRRASGRSTCSSTASRCATASSSRDRLSQVDARRCRSPSCCCRSCRSSRSTARTCSTRWSCSPSTRSGRTTGRPTRGHGLRRDQRAAHPVVHLERLGLVADGHRQPRHARPVPRHRADAGGPRPRQRPVRPVRPGRAGRARCGRPSTRRRSRPAGSCARGSASASPGTRSPRRWGTD